MCSISSLFSRGRIIPINFRQLFIAFSGGAKKNVLSTRCVEQTEHALTSYPKNPKIVWRSLIALTNLSSLNEESSMSILGLSVHNYVIGVYVRTGDNAVRQQIMWLFNSFLSWPRSRRKIHESIDSMRWSTAQRSGWFQLNSTMFGVAYFPWVTVMYTSHDLLYNQQQSCIHICHWQSHMTDMFSFLLHIRADFSPVYPS